MSRPGVGVGVIAEQASAPRRAAARWLSALKLAVTGGILALLFVQVDLVELAQVLRRSLGVWLWLALAANSLLLGISAWRWGRLLKAVGVVRSFASLFRFYAIGFFFSTLLPGTVGGDVVRWHAASEAPGLRLKVAATILAERITGLLALLALCFLLVAWDRRLATLPTVVLIASVAAGAAAAIGLGWSAGLARLLDSGARSRAAWLLAPLQRLHAALVDVPPRALVASVGYSLPFYATAGLVFFLVARACGAELDFVEAAAVQILICLLTLIPISLGGLGLTQAGDVYLLGLLGVDAATALGMSLVRLSLAYAYATLGALLFVSWRGRPSVSELRELSSNRAEFRAADGA